MVSEKQVNINILVLNLSVHFKAYSYKWYQVYFEII